MRTVCAMLGRVRASMEARLDVAAAARIAERNGRGSEAGAAAAGSGASDRLDRLDAKVTELNGQLKAILDRLKE
jgi:hypothetical protein